MKRILLFNILICAFVWEGYAQTITVDPEVICKGENSYIATNPSLNYVHIGDIICVGNNSNHDTIIVRPEAWSMYSGSYTALSVVFYVDESGKHGWAVKAATYSKAKWKGSAANANLNCIDNELPNRTALSDLNGYENTNCMRNNIGTSQMLSDLSGPFYLPAIGQLNYLYSQQVRVNGSLSTINIAFQIPTDKRSWSSTEASVTATGTANLITSVLVQDFSAGTISSYTKANLTTLYVLPVMNF